MTHIHSRLKTDRDLERVWNYMNKEEGAIHIGPWQGLNKAVREIMNRAKAWHAIAEVSVCLFIKVMKSDIICSLQRRMSFKTRSTS